MRGVTAQVHAVKARLVQQHPDVDIVAGSYCGGFVKRITAAAIYAACGCSLRKSRKVVDAARSELRTMRHPSANHAAQLRYEVALQATALAIAARTTAPRRKRKAQPRHP